MSVFLLAKCGNLKINGYQTCCELMGVTHGVKTREENEEAGIQWIMGEEEYYPIVQEGKQNTAQIQVSL